MRIFLFIFGVLSENWITEQHWLVPSMGYAWMGSGAFVFNWVGNGATTFGQVNIGEITSQLMETTKLSLFLHQILCIFGCYIFGRREASNDS
jgi:hypothetical protein